MKHSSSLFGALPHARNTLFIFAGVSALVIGWNFTLFFWLVFIGFVPLLNQLFKSLAGFRQAFILSYLYILAWQIGSTFWLFKTNMLNVALLNVMNSIIPALIIAGASQLKRRYQDRVTAYIAILAAWLIMESMQHRGDLAFPLLTLGNALGDWPMLIQWYEYTGVLGGTVWIWSVNFLFTEAYIHYASNKNLKARLIAIGASTCILPIVASSFIYQYDNKAHETVEIVSIHPHLDCYTEKYQMPVDSIIDHYLTLSNPLLTERVDFLVWPETAVPDGGWLETIKQDPLWQRVEDSLSRFPKLNLITGAVMYDLVRGNSEKHLPLVRFQEHSGLFYKTHNAAIQLRKGSPPQIRAKQKLVAFEETLPYPNILGFLDGLIPSLGDFAFSSFPDINAVFSNADGVRATPLICYETAFGSATAQYARNGAGLLMVLLNEGWYRNRFGARQFMRMSQIRAIECRRSVARSSNYGVSGFIDPWGKVVSATAASAPLALKANLPIVKRQTFFVKHNEWLGLPILAMFIGGLLLRVAYCAKGYKKRGRIPRLA
jgi:apolipoprotein N-acyltransferase